MTLDEARSRWPVGSVWEQRAPHGTFHARVVRWDERAFGRIAVEYDIPGSPVCDVHMVVDRWSRWVGERVDG